VALVLAAATSAVLPCAAPAFDPSREAANFARTQQRFQHEQSDPGYQAEVLGNGLRDTADILSRDASSQGKRFSGSLCGSGMLACAGDPRLYDYAGRLGLQIPVLYSNRNGAHIEGHVWISLRALKRVQASRRPRVVVKRVCRRRAPRHPRALFTGRVRCKRKRVKLAARPERLPGIVVETGSVQAPERWYYWIAQVLAAHDYAVMTFDVQGQGRSDALGTGPDAFQGVPAQDQTHFEEDLVDAIDFFGSRPSAPYKPRGAAAAQQQASEVGAKKATAWNPLFDYLDFARLGIAGHSLGASSVSSVQGYDKRVDALVAWDDLSAGVKPRVPALGMSADYGLVVYPHASDPDPESRNGGFADWRRAGVDTMQVNVRGGSHFEWSYSPSPALPASLRGIDMAAWYTTAWFDKYVKGDRTADRRLLTRRWLADPVDVGLQPAEKGNLLSFYLRSRAFFTRGGRGGGRVVCDDLRAGCPALVPGDGVPAKPAYSWRADRG
jgi:hypothetical protein